MHIETHHHRSSFQGRPFEAADLEVASQTTCSLCTMSPIQQPLDAAFVGPHQDGLVLSTLRDIDREVIKFVRRHAREKVGVRVNGQRDRIHKHEISVKLRSGT